MDQGDQVSLICKHKENFEMENIVRNGKNQYIGLINSNNSRSLFSQDSPSRSLQEVVMGIRTKERPASEYYKDLSCKTDNFHKTNKFELNIGLDWKLYSISLVSQKPQHRPILNNLVNKKPKQLSSENSLKEKYKVSKEEELSTGKNKEEGKNMIKIRE